MIDPNQDRRNFIGGSDVAAVMAQSRWSSPLRVWAEKTGRITGFEGNEAAELGTELEEFVSKKFERESGLKVRVDNRDFTHPDYDYMRYHVDRMIVGGDGKSLEAKTCSAYKADEWAGDGIPNEYCLQNNWGYGIIGLHRGKPPQSGYIAVLIGGQKFVWKETEFSQELFDLQVAAVKDFWTNYVLPEAAPMAISTDRDTLTELFPESRNEEMIRIEGGNDELSFNQTAADFLGGKEQMKLIEGEVEDSGNVFRQLIGELQGVESGQYVATWKTQNARSYIDTAKMKEDGIYNIYAEPRTSRVLRVKEKSAGK